MTTHYLDRIAKGVFLKAIAEDRAGELLECFFEGGSATLDPDGSLVMFPASVIDQMNGADE